MNRFCSKFCGIATFAIGGVAYCVYDAYPMMATVVSENAYEMNTKAKYGSVIQDLMNYPALLLYAILLLVYHACRITYFKKLYALLDLASCTYTRLALLGMDFLSYNRIAEMLFTDKTYVESAGHVARGHLGVVEWLGDGSVDNVAITKATHLFVAMCVYHVVPFVVMIVVPAVLSALLAWKAMTSCCGKGHTKTKKKSKDA